MSEKLSIITACSRPENLKEIGISIHQGWRYFDVEWFVVFDGMVVPPSSWIVPPLKHVRITPGVTRDPQSFKGNAQRNFGLDQILAGWVYVLDDDNIVHPAFFELLEQAIRSFPDRRAFVFPQETDGGWTRPAQPEMVRIGGIDTAQFVLRRDLIGDLRWRLPSPTSDGELMEQIYPDHKDEFAFIPRVASYYNRLRWVGYTPLGARS